MKFVKLSARGVDFYVNPEHVTAVAYSESEGAVGLAINGEPDPIYVDGAPMDIVAALEAATAVEFATGELISEFQRPFERRDIIEIISSEIQKENSAIARAMRRFMENM